MIAHKNVRAIDPLELLLDDFDQRGETFDTSGLEGRLRRHGGPDLALEP